MSSDAKVYLKSHFADDANKHEAGQGLSYVPLIGKELEGIESTEWLMSPAEQVGMIYLLEKLKPEVAIEIGTRFGGSLQVISRLSKKVYSLDLDPEVPQRLAGKHSNVEYITGSSLETLPTLVDRLQRENAPVSFVLIDGDHMAPGVRADIENVLKIRPIVPLFVLLHDTYNPECRKGMTTANWAASPYVHAVELDFVSGTIFPRGDLWGGLGVAVLLPEKRTGDLEVTGRGHRAIQGLLPLHSRRVFKDQVRGYLTHRWKQLLGKK